MNASPLLHVTLAALLLGVAGCQAAGNQYRNRGTTLGSVAGALTGAAIGGHNDKPLAGAAIGAAVGALAGSTIGAGMDRDVAQAEQVAFEQEQQRLAGAVTIQDVIGMSQSQLSDQVIINHIRNNGTARKPQVPDLIVMQQAGVSSAVIRAMQEAGAPRAVVAAAPPPPVRPIVVEEHHYVAPRRWRPPCRPIPPCRPPGLHWGISFSN